MLDNLQLFTLISHRWSFTELQTGVILNENQYRFENFQ